jgi:rubrerythrin
MEILEKGTALDDEQTEDVTGGVNQPLGGEIKEFVCTNCGAKITYLNEPPKSCPLCAKNDSDAMRV